MPLVPRLLLPASALILLTGAAQAHPGMAVEPEAAAGLLHPLCGADHVLAMVAVGLLAALRGGRAAWLLPGTFLVLMAAGAGLGMGGIALPFVEVGIAASVLVLGLATAAGSRGPLAALAALVGGFAVLHGHAHGAEMPESAAGVAFGAGFLAATALLHGAGLGLGLLGARLGPARVGPVLGGVVAAAGLALLAAAM